MLTKRKAGAVVLLIHTTAPAFLHTKKLIDFFKYNQ